MSDSTPPVPGALPTGRDGEPTFCSKLESKLFPDQLYPLTQYPELQELAEELIQDEEVKTKRLGTPAQFESRTMDGDLSTDPTFFRDAPRDSIVVEMIAQGIHVLVQHQQIDTLWRLYNQGQKEIEQLRTENAHLQEQLQHHPQAPSPNSSAQIHESTTVPFASLLLPRMKRPQTARRVGQDRDSTPPPPRENREDSTATNASQPGQRSAKFRDPPQLSDGVNPSF